MAVLVPAPSWRSSGSDWERLQAHHYNWELPQQQELQKQRATHRDAAGSARRRAASATTSMLGAGGNRASQISMEELLDDARCAFGLPLMPSTAKPSAVAAAAAAATESTKSTSSLSTPPPSSRRRRRMSSAMSIASPMVMSPVTPECTTSVSPGTRFTFFFPITAGEFELHLYTSSPHVSERFMTGEQQFADWEVLDSPPPRPTRRRAALPASGSDVAGNRRTASGWGRSPRDAARGGDKLRKSLFDSSSSEDEHDEDSAAQYMEESSSDDATDNTMSSSSSSVDGEVVRYGCNVFHANPGSPVTRFSAAGRRLLARFPQWASGLFAAKDCECLTRLQICRILADLRQHHMEEFAL